MVHRALRVGQRQSEEIEECGEDGEMEIRERVRGDKVGGEGGGGGGWEERRRRREQGREEEASASGGRSKKRRGQYEERDETRRRGTEGGGEGRMVGKRRNEKWTKKERESDVINTLTNLNQIFTLK